MTSTLRLLVSSLVCTTVLAPGAAIASIDLACLPAPRQSSYAVGALPEATAKPVMVPLETMLDRRGNRETELRTFKLAGEKVTGLPADYAMMRLSRKAGKPLWVITANGLPAPAIDLEIGDGDLASALDRIAAAASMRWRYDGQSIYLLDRREWTVLLPAERDLALAVQQMLSLEAPDAKVEKGVVRIPGDETKAAAVAGLVSRVYAQTRLNPFDVTWYKVYPTRGVIDWATLAERTESVRDFGFAGKGAAIVLDGEAEGLIETFLSREGTVRKLGLVTMVAPETGGKVARVAGCGDMIEAERGIELTANGGETGKVDVRYQLTGADDDVSGSTTLSLDQTLVVASRVPHEGAFLVGIIHSRVLEVAGSSLPVQNSGFGRSR